MKRKELNGKNVMENDEQETNKPYKSEERERISEKVNSDRTVSGSHETESDRATKNEDEGIRGAE